MRFTLADVLDWADSYDGPPFHALISDMPYHLTEIVKRFGSPTAAPAQAVLGGPYARASRGFMGQTWDGGDLAFRSETWAKLGRHLYPGSFGVAFAGSRGWHRMAVAIEDAGLIVHPTIFGWCYGSGFPKSTRPDTHMTAQAFRAWLAERPADRDRLRDMTRAGRRDPAVKAEAEALKIRLLQEAGLIQVRGERAHAPKFAAAEHGYREKDNGYNSRERETFLELAPQDPLAAAWAGHRYGLQAMKPAVEPIVLFQRPHEGPPIRAMAETGAGGLWIDGARIGTADDMNPRDFDDSRRTAPKFDGIYNGGREGLYLERRGTVPPGR